MPINLRQEVVIEVIRQALNGQDHRDVVIDKIDEAFVQDVIAFFEQVVVAKIRNEDISVDWYREGTFLTKVCTNPTSLGILA